LKEILWQDLKINSGKRTIFLTNALWVAMTNKFVFS